MASFTSFQIYPLETGIRLAWTFEGRDLAADPVYYIDRSVDSGSTWIRLNPSSGVDSWMYDIDPLSESIYMSTTQYRVAASVDGSETLSRTLTAMGNKTERETAFLHSLMTQMRARMLIPGVSLPGSLYRRRTAGQACSDCIDPATGEIYNSNCASCYGTGMQGGYYGAVSQPAEILGLEDYDRQWRSLSGSYSSDARAVRMHLPCKWIEGDIWSDGSEGFVLTSAFKVEAFVGDLPLTYTGIIDKLPAGSVLEGLI